MSNVKVNRFRVHYAWLILIGCCMFTLAVLGIVNSCQGLFLIPVTKALGISRAKYSLAITIQGLMGIVTMPIAGRVLPKYNIRVVLTIAVMIFIGGFSGLSLCRNINQFLFLSAILGAAGGFLTFIPVAVLIGNWFQEKQGFALGLAMAFTGIGGAIFNPIGSYFIQFYGWRTSYQLLGIISLLFALPATIGIFRFSPEEMGTTAYGSFKAAGNYGLTGMKAKEAFRSSSFVFVVIWCISVGILGGVMYHIPAFVSQWGYSASFGGTIMSIFMLSMTLGKIILGYLNDKLGEVASIAIYGTFTFLGLACFLMSGRGAMWLIIGAALFGPGMALMLVESPIIVRKNFGNADYSVIYAAVSMLFNVISTTSVLVYGIVFDKMQSYVPVFAVIIICPLLAFASSLISFKLTKNDFV